ncbi:hypothetical protein ACS0TY_029420 [Phlomoides rotata]
MDSQNQETRGRGKNKRKWKYDEDAKLIEALLDMINFGAYKANNGFKPGHLNYVEEKAIRPIQYGETRIFLFYDDLLIVFGKDRSTGANDDGPADMEEEIQREENNNEEINNVEATMGMVLRTLMIHFLLYNLQEMKQFTNRRREEIVQVLII